MTALNLTVVREARTPKAVRLLVPEELVSKQVREMLGEAETAVTLAKAECLVRAVAAALPE